MFCKPYFDCSVGAETALNNPDISGIGVSLDLSHRLGENTLTINYPKVVIGFVVTAWATLFALVVHYVAIPPEAWSNNRQFNSNPLDCAVHNWIWKTFRNTRSLGWAPNMESVSMVLTTAMHIGVL